MVDEVVVDEVVADEVVLSSPYLAGDVQTHLEGDLRYAMHDEPASICSPPWVLPSTAAQVLAMADLADGLSDDVPVRFVSETEPAGTVADCVRSCPDGDVQEWARRLRAAAVPALRPHVAWFDGDAYRQAARGFAGAVSALLADAFDRDPGLAGTVAAEGDSGARESALAQAVGRDVDRAAARFVPAGWDVGTPRSGWALTRAAVAAVEDLATAPAVRMLASCAPDAGKVVAAVGDDVGPLVSFWRSDVPAEHVVEAADDPSGRHLQALAALA